MNNGPTKTDPNAREWTIDDEPLRLRYWASDRHHVLPIAPNEDSIIGTSEECEIAVTDPSGETSRRHAKLWRENGRWMIRDLGSKNGIRVDGARRDIFELVPGIEIGIGRLVLIVESARLIALRRLLARVLGWKEDRSDAVDLALRAVRMAASRRMALVVCGQSDANAVAYGIHRITLGPERPFIACDPRRREVEESVRSVTNYPTATAAFEEAFGGSLCVWSSRLPRDFGKVEPLFHQPESRVQLVVCSTKARESKPFLAEPIVIPSLSTRPDEIENIIQEYAHDAIFDLRVAPESFKRIDRDWIRDNMATSLTEIERATLRIVALRAGGNPNRAAAMLGMAHVSLSRWIMRAKLRQARLEGLSI